MKPVAKPQPTNDLVHIGVKQHSSGAWQQFLLIFLRTKLLSAQNKLDIVRGRVKRSFSPGAVATIALWKLAPMGACV